MIELSNSTAQELQPGQALTFDLVKLKTGCNEKFYTMIPTSVRLVGKGCNPIYDVEFHGNITSNTAGAAIQLALAIGGVTLVDTAMNAVPAAAGDLWNVSAGKYIPLACCDDGLDRISVVNSGTVALTVAPGVSFRVARQS